MDQPLAPPPDGSGPPPGPEPATGWSPSRAPVPGQGPSTPAGGVPPTSPGWAAPTPPTSPGWAATTPPPPPATPGWGAPTTPRAPVGWAPPPVEAVGHQATTGFAKAAGFLLILFGLLASLFGLLFVAVASVAKDFTNTYFDTETGASIGGLITAIGIFVIVIGVVQIMAGIGSWRGAGWARVIGLVYGVLGTLLGLTSVAGSRSAEARSAIGSSVVILAVYGFITLALAFRWKSRAR